MLIIKGDKNIVTVTRVYIASPEGANGRNVVAYGMLNALTSKYKTMVFRPAVSNHDEFTPILLAASNAGLGVALSTGLDVHKVREDKNTARGDIVGAFNDAMDVSRADAALIVGTDKSHVNDPTSYEFDANVAADLKAGVFLAVCTINRWPHELDETVKLSIEGMEAAGNKVLGIFVTGCEPRHAFSVKETLAKYGLPVWTLPQVPFTDESTKDLALEAFRKNAPTDEVLAALDVDVTAPITPYAFQFGLLGKAKSNKKTIVLPEGEEDRIIKAADYLLEREIVNLIIVGNKDAILARGKELGLNYLDRARFQAMDDENVLKPMVAKLCELRAKKGMTEEQARKQLTDASYFGTMLVVLGYADGLVSGSVNSTANTVRPALQVIKTKPGQKLVSGAFLMCFKDHVAVFSDCAINLNPDAEQLSEIALQGPCGRVLRLRHQPQPGCRAAFRNRVAVRRDRTCLRHRPEGRYALLLHPRLRQGTGRGHGRGSHQAAQGEGSGSAGGRFHPVRRRLVPHRSRHQGQGQRCGWTRQRVRLPGPVRRQHRLQSCAALLRRLGHRPGAAGSQQAGKRPVPWCSGAGHHQHHRPHRHRSAVSPAWLPVAPASGSHRNAFFVASNE